MNILAHLPRIARFSLAAAALLVLQWALPARAGAAVTIGSDLAGVPTSTASDQTIASTAIPGRPVTAPAAGVIHVWRIKTQLADAGIAVRLRIIRPLAGGGRGIATGPTVTLAGGTEQFTILPQGLPMASGDLIGIDNGVGPVVDGASVWAPTAGASVRRWSPFLGDGESRPASGTSDNAELLVNADIEPDADCDGLGDETQDLSVSGGCLPAPPSPPPEDGVLPSNEFSFGKVKKNKKKGTAKLTVTNLPGPGELELTKNKKVKQDTERVEAAAAGTTQDGITAKLTVKPKGKAKKKLNKKGKAKVKAEVTYTPDGGEPNTKSRKVGLKKKR